MRAGGQRLDIGRALAGNRAPARTRPDQPPPDLPIQPPVDERHRPPHVPELGQDGKRVGRPIESFACRDGEMFFRLPLVRWSDGAGGRFGIVVQSA
jgi:hypothetical protein